jgi:hypothetical protein
VGPFALCHIRCRNKGGKALPAKPLLLYWTDICHRFSILARVMLANMTTELLTPIPELYGTSQPRLAGYRAKDDSGRLPLIVPPVAAN